jgi:hypothetical protein
VAPPLSLPHMYNPEAGDVKFVGAMGMIGILGYGTGFWGGRSGLCAVFPGGYAFHRLHPFGFCMVCLPSEKKPSKLDFNLSCWGRGRSGGAYVSKKRLNEIRTIMAKSYGHGPPSGSKIVRTTGLLRVLYLIYGLVGTSYITSYEAHNPIIGETRLHCRVVLTMMVISNAKMTFMTTG